ncbi:MAG: hypothetical protein A2X82_12435 [Geobacteraceae bacterium GWC2_55_20]|nr:MAG: hypothetical protein A2X82_12435 [Geobacteraceae bacterium GWC2_55_20]
MKDREDDSDLLGDDAGLDEMQGEEGERAFVAFGDDIDGEQQCPCMVKRGVVGAGETVEDEV